MHGDVLQRQETPDAHFERKNVYNLQIDEVKDSSFLNRGVVACNIG